MTGVVAAGQHETVSLPLTSTGLEEFDGLGSVTRAGVLYSAPPRFPSVDGILPHLILFQVKWGEAAGSVKVKGLLDVFRQLQLTTRQADDSAHRVTLYIVRPRDVYVSTRALAYDFKANAADVQLSKNEVWPVVLQYALCDQADWGIKQGRL